MIEIEEIRAFLRSAHPAADSIEAAGDGIWMVKETTIFPETENEEKTVFIYRLEQDQIILQNQYRVVNDSAYYNG